MRISRVGVDDQRIRNVNPPDTLGGIEKDAAAYNYVERIARGRSD
jgi:hypothetical protein